MQLLKLVLQISFGPIGWLMISEIFPLRLRGRGLSIAVLVNFGANALVTFAFSPLKVLKSFNTSYFPKTIFFFYFLEYSHAIIRKKISKSLDDTIHTEFNFMHGNML